MALAAEIVKTVLFAVDRARDPGFDTADSLAELEQLAWSAGAMVMGRLVQRRDEPDPATYLGEGKLAELAELMSATGAALAVCDDELTPAQIANLSDKLPGDVIDRTQLILDIFASRASSREGKVQVEMAQLRYLLPRLTGRGTALSRLGGGIGTRGPGETKLETDRRHARRRIAELRRELNRIKQRRVLHIEARRDAAMRSVALVGYTNAGKSSLRSTLAGAEVPCEDRLFTTLDPTIRGVRLPEGETILLVDTVGFIRKLPHELVAAFRATLEEVVDADVLVHVIDSAHPQLWEQAAAVHDVLQELGVADKPIVTAFNKADLGAPGCLEALVARTPWSCAVSALTGDGCDRLLTLIGEALPEGRVTRTYRIPYGDAKVASWLHESGRVLEETFGPEAVTLTVELRQQMAERVCRFEL
jgi:GTP-binding protein HflX